MKVLGINHLGIAAKDPEKAKEFFSNILGLAHLGDEVAKEQKTSTSMIRSSNIEVQTSETRLEILAPTQDDSPIAKYLAKKGGGIHHIALTVDDIENAIAFMLEKKVEMVDTIPRNGVHNTKIAFIHPRSTGGILVELVQETK